MHRFGFLVGDAIMQNERKSLNVNPEPESQIICVFLYCLSLSDAYEAIQHVLLSCAISLRHFSLSRHASMSAALPTGS